MHTLTSTHADVCRCPVPAALAAPPTIGQVVGASQVQVALGALRTDGVHRFAMPKRGSVYFKWLHEIGAFVRERKCDLTPEPQDRQPRLVDAEVLSGNHGVRCLVSAGNGNGKNLDLLELPAVQALVTDVHLRSLAAVLDAPALYCAFPANVAST